jgi:hypothetical protein
MNADYLEPKSGTVAGKLASGVRVEDQIERDFIVQEMTGVEEDLLAGKGNLMTRLNQVIINCTVSLGVVSERREVANLVKRLTAVDRMILLISIRRASLGDMYRVKYSCPQCSGTNNAAVDLSGLEITSAESETDVHETTLASGRLVKWHTMTGADEEWLQEQQKRQERTGRADVLTLAILTRVDEVDGEPLNRSRDLKGALTTLKSMRLSERNELREVFQSNEGAIDTEVEYECAHCSHQFSADLDVGQAGFFFPSGI